MWQTRAEWGKKMKWPLDNQEDYIPIIQNREEMQYSRQETPMTRSGRVKQGGKCSIDQYEIPMADRIKEWREILTTEMSQAEMNWGRKVGQRIAAAVPGQSAV